MNCDQFYKRLQWLLDNRQDVSSDPQLNDHCDACDACHDRLHLWSEIECVASSPETDQVPEEISPLPSTYPRTAWHRHLAWASLAATALLVVTFSWWADPSSQSSDHVITAAVMPDSDFGNQTFQTGQSQLHPNLSEETSLAWQNAQWWSVVTEEDWVIHTMPAVDSVRQGVAPIGRSMRQAIAILMTSHRESALPADSHAPSLQSTNFTEQTSVIPHGSSLSTIA